MTIVFSGSPVSNVELSDSFNTWRLTTNKLLADAASLTANNIFAGQASFTSTVTATQASFTSTVTANNFVGDGSLLTNAGSTVASDTSDSRDLLVPFTGIVSGTMTSANVNSTFTFNPGTGTMTANTVKTSSLKDSSNRVLTIRDEANTIVWGG